MSKTYDIAVLGSTPAAFAASYHLAKEGLDVANVVAPSRAVESPLLEWIPRDLLKLSELPGDLGKKARAVAFKKARFHSMALDKEVDYRSRTVVGHFVRSGDLASALKSAAGKAGAKMRSSKTTPTVSLQEDGVEVIGSSRVAARMLLIAHDRPSDVVSELSLPVRTVPRSELVVSGLDVPISGKTPKDLSEILHVVELPERTEMGMYFAHRDVLHMRVVSSSAAAGNRAEELSSMVAHLQQKELVPDTLQLHRATGATWHPPAGVALELEAHVAKRCLLVGTAGGFVETITGHTLLPCVRSALLGAEVAIKALKSEDTQEVLMSFKTHWRKTLADYLRPPNTSLHMLLPLLFANERIVAKFTRALLYGENI